MESDNGPQPRAKKAPRRRPIDFGSLEYLYTHCALIRGTRTVWDGGTQEILPADTLNLAYPDAYKVWLRSPERRIIHPRQIKFDPSGASLAPGDVNLFCGWGVEPRQGDCSHLLRLLNHLCAGDLEMIDFVLRWIALPLQQPGTKMKTSLIFHGDEGAGKNLFFEAVADIYGQHSIIIGQEQLDQPYNAWLSRKLFAIADEVISREELRHYKGRLNALITGRSHLINDKWVSLREEPNLINLVFFSNEIQPLILHHSDRRYAVAWTPPVPDRELHKAVVAEIAAGGISALYWHLLHRVDCSGFTAHAKPPMTAAKADLIDLALPSPLAFWRAWSGGDLPLRLEPVRSSDLYMAYRAWMHSNGDRFVVSHTRFARELKRHCTADQRWARLPGSGARDRPRIIVPPGCRVSESEYALGEVFAAWHQDVLTYAEGCGFKGR